MALLIEEQTQAQLQCLLISQKETLPEQVEDCEISEIRAIELLGVLSSQRMYLIRDFAEFARQTYSPEQFDRYYTNAQLSSQLYFQLETMAHQLGVEAVYPKGQKSVESRKPYHFYSVAYIALKMRQAGFNEAIVRKFANQYAVKYKKNIKLVGLVYNILIGVPIANGSVGDAKQIMQEQIQGIEYALQLDLSQ